MKERKVFFKKDKEVRTFDSSKFQPALLVSICTGEITFGFIELDTLRFRGECLIKDEKELSEIARSYGLDPKEIKRIY